MWKGPRRVRRRSARQHFAATPDKAHWARANGGLEGGRGAATVLRAEAYGVEGPIASFIDYGPWVTGRVAGRIPRPRKFPPAALADGC